MTLVSLVLSWFTMEQVVDLKAEGLWDELLDEFQPEILIQDWWVNEHHHPPHPPMCEYVSLWSYQLVITHEADTVLCVSKLIIHNVPFRLPSWTV